MSKTKKEVETDSAEKLSFEAAFEKLQGTVKRLESGELNLEASLRDFEEGVRLTRLCQEYLKNAEQRVEVLMSPSSPANSAKLDH
jgi:exodeoxyribonuclease VII small subunit